MSKKLLLIGCVFFFFVACSDDEQDTIPLPDEVEETLEEMEGEEMETEEMEAEEMETEEMEDEEMETEEMEDEEMETEEMEDEEMEMEEVVLVTYDIDIAPLIEGRCYPCHAMPARGGPFSLNTFDLVSERAAGILNAIQGINVARIMPPSGDPLTSEQVALFEQWITDGLLEN